MMEGKAKIPESFWKELDQVLTKYTGPIAKLLLEEALMNMGKKSKEEVLIPEAPVLLEKLLIEMDKIASPKFFRSFKREVIAVFNRTFTSF